MLGRLIDQLFPAHVSCPSEAAIISSIRSRASTSPHLESFSLNTPWGNSLPLLSSADLNIINLETSATTHDVKWPNKVFNYRMHPTNIAALKTAGIHYAGLTNNHTLDFSRQGLLDTVHAVRTAGIAYAGAGTTRAEALAPAVLKLPATGGGEHEVHVYAASDHPDDWGSVEEFHLIDYSTGTRQRLKDMLTTRPRPSLKVFSVHWGPNYAWKPAKEIRDLAHFLVDECGIDVVHGHSSHHVQGVEVRNGSLIIYGCGDFVDDYAVVEGGWRNDLSAVWQVRVQEEEGEDMRLVPERLEVFPNRIQEFQAHLLEREDKDHEWVVSKVKDLSGNLGTRSKDELGEKGQLVVNLL